MYLAITCVTCVPKDKNAQRQSASMTTLIYFCVFFAGPVYNSVPFKFRNIGEALYSIDWLPVKVGTYDLDVKYGQMIPVWGSPMQIRIYDAKKVKVEHFWTEPPINERHLMKGNDH